MLLRRHFKTNLLVTIHAGSFLMECFLRLGIHFLNIIYTIIWRMCLLLKALGRTIKTSHFGIQASTPLSHPKSFLTQFLFSTQLNQTGRRTTSWIRVARRRILWSTCTLPADLGRQIKIYMKMGPYREVASNRRKWGLLAIWQNMLGLGLVYDRHRSGSTFSMKAD